MFSRIQRQFGTAGLVVAIVALVAALAGGAYAASGGLTGKQKKEVEKISKKFAGKDGANGAAGANGTNGANGKDGTNGGAGSPGANGKTILNGTTVPAAGLGTEGDFYIRTTTSEIYGPKTTVWGSPTSLKGAQGTPGETGFTATLPIGKTETGVWSFGFTEKGAYPQISFAIPIAAALGESQVHYLNKAGKEVIENLITEVPEEVTSTQCLGTPEAPTAVAGNLCVYTGAMVGTPLIVSQYIVKAGGSQTPFAASGASTAGSVMLVQPTSLSHGGGTWAVTAP